MNRTTSRWLSLCAFAFAFAFASGTFEPAQASAQDFPCDAMLGTMRMVDFDFPDVCQFVDAGANDPDYSTGPFNDRMDLFGNDDFTFGRSLCLYNDAQFVNLAVEIVPGFESTTRNSVSSHFWASPGGC